MTPSVGVSTQCKEIIVAEHMVAEHGLVLSVFNMLCFDAVGWVAGRASGL